MRREQLDLTQAELALRISAGQNQIYRYERGDAEPSAEVLAKLAAELLVTSDWLLGLTDDPAPAINETDLQPDELRLIEVYRLGQYGGLVKFAVDQMVKNEK